MAAAASLHDRLLVIDGLIFHSDGDARDLMAGGYAAANVTVKDPIARENPKGPYVNIIAVRTEDKNKPWVKALVESYHTPEVKAFIEEKFKGSVLTSW